MAMKCFIHNDVEAVSACKICGKGMCANCSAYSGHTGVCPACRLAEFERTSSYLKKERKGLIFRLVVSILAVIVLLFTVLVLAIVPAVLAVINFVKIKKKDERIKYYDGEIEKLRSALRQGSAMI